MLQVAQNQIWLKFEAKTLIKTRKQCLKSIFIVFIYKKNVCNFFIAAGIHILLLLLYVYTKISCFTLSLAASSSRDLGQEKVML